MKGNKTTLTAVLLTFAATAFAGTDAGTPVGTGEIEAVSKALKLAYPKTRFQKVSPTPITGIYEVVMGKNVAYVDANVRYFLFGTLFDMEKQEDLTERSRSESNRVDFSSLPLDIAIKTVRGNGERVLAVFSDPDCPYCKKLEADLVKLDNVTVYTFLMPLDSLHPNAAAKADAVWCQSDRSAAWTNLMLKGKTPKPVAGCVSPVKETVALGARLGINGTPYLIASDGRTMPGAADVARLESFVGGSKQ